MPLPTSKFLSRGFILLAVTLLQFPVSAQPASERFHALLDSEWEWRMLNAPEFATYVGYPGQNHRWTDRSQQAIEDRKAHMREALATLETIDREALGQRDRLFYDLYLRDLKMIVEGQRFKGEYLAVDQMGGPQLDIAGTINRMPQQTVADYQNIVARIRSANAPIEQTISLLNWGLETGITAPRVTLRNVPEQVLNQMVSEPKDSPLLEPFSDFPADISQEDQTRLRADAESAVAEVLVPAYRKLHEFLVTDYLPGARESIAMSALPDGDAWYAHEVRRFTTTDMTPQEIHDLGRSEVRRIRSEMDEVIRESGFTGSFEEFTHFLRTDPQFYFEDAESLLSAYRDVAKRVDPELTLLFGTLPRLPYGIKPVPAYSEKSQTTAYYQPGSARAARPGYFFANTYALETRPRWEIEALTLHEAVPGHHLQIAIAQEQEDAPEFRKWGGYTAFVEGWGLYAESLGDEIGMYKDPYSKFGKLTYEMWRAIRLVVDTGMHALGWSREQAIDYFQKNSGRQLHDITVEVDRYIVWPGQALAYKIGELKFKELRARAREELGEQFDVRLYHDTVLENGALPMDVLEDRIDDWIAERKVASRSD